MWSICRVDQDPFTNKISYFEVQAAYRKADLEAEAARRSGFVSLDDELVIVSPSGKESHV
jgi:hypothetical protein